MHVILTTPVRNLGKIGDEIKVKAGYARNYLIPKTIAIRATESNRALVAAQKLELEKKNTELHSKAQEVANLLQGKELFFIKQAADDGRLYGSLNNKEIAKAVSDLIVDKNNATSHKFSAGQILLHHPLKTIGAFEFGVSVHPEVNVTLNLSIGRTDIEAKDLMRMAKVEPEVDAELLN